MTMRWAMAGYLLAGMSACLLFSCAREEAPWVAKANGDLITAEQFRERYEQYLEASGVRDNILARKQVLENMINERLIFQDLKDKQRDSDPVTRSRLEEIRLQAILDEYTRNLTVDTITASDQEVQAEFEAYNTKVSARYLYAKTREDALRMKEQISNGATFASLAREVFDDPGLANNGGYLGTFGWGEMEPELEKAAFSEPVGAVSDPIRLKIGYALVRVETRVRRPLASEYDFAKVKEKLTRAVKERKTARAISSLTDGLVADLHPEFNDEGVSVALRAWPHLSASARNSQEERPRLVNPDTAAIPLLRYTGGEWSVGDFMSRALHTSDRQQRRVHTRSDIENVARGLLVREVLLARAGGLDLEQRPSVQRQIAKVRDDYLLRRWTSRVQDTVGTAGWSTDTLRARYERDRGQYVEPPLVNVAEILVRTRAEAEEMMRRLRSGAQFAGLAKRYSIRLWASKQGGELGFGSRSDFGILGEKFLAGRPGQVLGPEFVDPYWGVFRILAHKPGRPILFDEAREQVSQSLTAEARQAAVRRAVSDLRTANSVEIQMHVLENVALSDETQH